MEKTAVAWSLRAAGTSRATARRGSRSSGAGTEGSAAVGFPDDFRCFDLSGVSPATDASSYAMPYADADAAGARPCAKTGPDPTVRTVYQCPV